MPDQADAKTGASRDDVAAGLRAAMAARGFAYGAVPVARLAALRDELDAWRQRQLLAEDVYLKYLRGFTFTPPAGFDEGAAVVVAVPDAPVRFTFAWGGREVVALMPPTYLRARDVDRRAGDALAEALEPHGYRIQPVTLPKKLLAAHSGVAAYGKNNLAYVPALGTFHRLACFFTDFLPPDAAWLEPRALPRCDECDICQRRCPTGAVAADRFLLHAEKCVTLYNEAAAAFPPALEPFRDDCLIGCLRCQLACPENKEVRDRRAPGEAFTAEETSLLLAATALERLPAETRAKLERSGLAAFYDILPRNLAAIRTR